MDFFKKLHKWQSPWQIFGFPPYSTLKQNRCHQASFAVDAELQISSSDGKFLASQLNFPISVQMSVIHMSS